MKIPLQMCLLQPGRVADLASIPGFSVDLFPGRVIPVTLKSVLQWLPCKMPCIIGSVPELLGAVSTYRDWVR